MRVLNKQTISKFFNALVVTFAFAALCHLLLVTVVAIARRSISYVNPLDFLGISIILPQYRDSTIVAAAGWLVLIALFFVILFIRIHYHWYISIIRENWITTRLTETTNKLYEVSKQLPKVPRPKKQRSKNTQG